MPHIQEADRWFAILVANKHMEPKITYVSKINSPIAMSHKNLFRY